MKRATFLALCFLGAIACSSDDDPGVASKQRKARSDAGMSNAPAQDSGAPWDEPGDAPDSGQDASRDPDTTPGRPYTHYDVNHVLLVGQSNSVSNSGRPVLSTTQPASNLMFNTGVMPMMGNKSNPNGGCDGNGCTTYQAPTSFVPLREGDGFFNPLDGVETAASGAANAMSFLYLNYAAKNPGSPVRHDVLASLHGRSGNTYWCLRKGGCNYKQGYLSPFAQGMMEVASGKALAEASGKSYVVRAVLVIHGESDHYSYTAGVQEFPLPSSSGTGVLQDYADALIEWQRDYETEVKKITGQKEPVVMFVSQLSGWNDAKTSRLAQMQFDAHVREPDKVVLVGPSYALHLNQQDCLHYTSTGERELGEMFARAYSRVVFEGKRWDPVSPKSATLVGNVITVRYNVPHPPLAIDTTKVAQAQNLGFEFSDAPIANVNVTSDDTVTITLANVPGAGSRRLTYGQNQPVPGCTGTPNGARGNIRDSDTSVSRNGYDQSNWSVIFDIQVK